MVYDHAVKAYGKFYPAGADVPEEIAETPQEASETAAGVVPGEPTEAPSAKRKTAKKEKLE